MSSSGNSARYPSLQDVVVLITGGASGIGATMVEHFAHQHARVAFLDIAEEIAAALCKKLSTAVPSEPAFFKCDLTDIADLRSTIKKIEAQFGAIRVLVNNAAN